MEFGAENQPYDEANSVITSGSSMQVVEDEQNNVSVEREDTIMISKEQDNIRDFSSSLISLTGKCIEEIYEAYCKHGSEVGFSVRKGTSIRNVAGMIVGKIFFYSCEGMRVNKGISLGGKERSTNRNITRTNCKTMLKIKLRDGGLYEVSQHNMEHNHTLCRKELSYMLRSNRGITNEKAALIEDMVSSGIKAADSFRFMAQDAGGEEVLSHTKRDHFNFVNRLKMLAIEGGDAQTLIDILHQQSVEDPDFFFRVRLDEEGRFCNVFWRDSMMKEDFMIYGDVLVFDTTYRTNRYNLICAPFVGLNNHLKNVMFGCAFISNEQTESFQWLFDVFKKSMGNKSPVTIFTGQDKAISNGLETVFSSAKHRLCIWHLYQNAVTRFGELKSDKGFNDAFTKCFTGCSNIDEFEHTWNSMLSSYGLQDKEWFGRLYGLREKWSNAYNNDFFSAGILSSQRSESTNQALGFGAKKTTSLTDFYHIFQKTVEQWRSNESKDEFQCSLSQPVSYLPLSGILKHASEVYTLTIFKKFEREFLLSICTTFQLVSEENNKKIYQVSDDRTASLQYVYFSGSGSVICCCSCKKFEECGLLCYHCLRILHVHCVAQIPDIYIMKRWTKIAKSDIWNKAGEANTKSQKSSWRSQMMRNYSSVIIKAQESEKLRNIVEDGLSTLISKVDGLISMHQTSGDATEISSSSNQVLDPSYTITKGRKQQRIKSNTERKRQNKRTSKTISSSAPSREFGTKTPN